MQYESFGLFGDASVGELAGYLGVGEQMARRHMASLEDKSVVEKQKLRKPLTFALSDDFKVSVSLDIPNRRNLF